MWCTSAISLLVIPLATATRISLSRSVSSYPRRPLRFGPPLFERPAQLADHRPTVVVEKNGSVVLFQRLGFDETVHHGHQRRPRHPLETAPHGGSPLKIEHHRIDQHHVRLEQRRPFHETSRLIEQAAHLEFASAGLRQQTLQTGRQQCRRSDNRYTACFFRPSVHRLSPSSCSTSGTKIRSSINECLLRSPSNRNRSSNKLLRNAPHERSGRYLIRMFFRSPSFSSMLL